MSLILENSINKVPKKAPNRNYFTQETEDAIILYNSTEDFALKSRIFNEKIYYAFFKLTQNIIHTFKFYHTDVEDLEHLQQEIIIFLLSKIHLYHHSNNIQARIKKIIIKEFKEEYDKDFCTFTNNSPKITQQQINEFLSTLDISNTCMDKLSKLTPPKAYSYFGTIVKRWLILYNSNNYKKKINKVSTDELLKDTTHSYTLNSTPEIEKLSGFIDEWVEFISFNIYDIFPKEYDAKIADSILELFRKRNQIDIFNKKALYIYIHEMVPSAKTPKITKIANLLYDNFKKNYSFYLEQGYTDFQLL